MGARASFATVENGKTTLYYSHWGADSLVRSVFFGPEAAAEFIRSNREVDGLLDEVWAEAGAILDFDARRFTFFSTDGFHAEFRHYFLTLMQTNWPEWDLRWVLNGIIEIAEILGHDLTPLRCSSVKTDICFQPPELTQPPRYISTVVSIREKNQVRDFEAQDDASNLLAMGPALVAVTRGWPSVARVSAVQSEDLGNGIFLDCDVGRISACDILGNHLERCRDLLQSRWPGWHLEVRHEGLPGQ